MNVTWVDQPPVANAGKDSCTDFAGIVTLDGSASSDADDGSASYLWRQVSGPQVSLEQADSPIAAFMAPDSAQGAASLVFELTVTDFTGLVSRDQVTVNVVSTNNPPVANAGRNVAAPSSAKVTLNGSASSDPEGKLATYQWTQTAGPPVVLTDAASATPSFVAPGLTSGSVVLVFKLTVTDAGGLSSTGKCAVTVRAKSGTALASN